MPETEAPSQDEIAATLEIGDGAARISVYVAVLEQDGVPTGYLRMAYGQGNLINRLLTSVGETARLIGPSGNSRVITITSSDPKDATGYLCTFNFVRPDAQPARPEPLRRAVSPVGDGAGASQP